MQSKSPSDETLDPHNYLDSSDQQAEMGLLYWMFDIMLFIMEWGVVHIGGGCSFERNYGETFHRNCYYRGKGIGFPFYQY